MRAMTPEQVETVALIQGALPSFLTYRNTSGEDTSVILFDPAQPLSLIAVETDGVTSEFDGTEWQTGWTA